MNDRSREPILQLIVRRLTNLIYYLLEVIKHKDELLDVKYRIVDWYDSKGIGYCKVHLVGTSRVDAFTPQKILSDDSFLCGFSKLDIRTITNLANYEKYKVKAIVGSIDYEDQIIRIKTLSNIESNIKLNEIQNEIEQLSKTDVFNLGRLVGEKDTQL